MYFFCWVGVTEIVIEEWLKFFLPRHLSSLSFHLFHLPPHFFLFVFFRLFFFSSLWTFLLSPFYISSSKSCYFTSSFIPKVLSASPMGISMFFLSLLFFCSFNDACVMVSVGEHRLSEQGSISGRSCLRFTVLHESVSFTRVMGK